MVDLSPEDVVRLRNAAGDIAADLIAEYMRARVKNSPMQSAHEGYAVILEEMDELWDHVKMKASKRDFVEMRKEAVQIGAMSMAFALEICDTGNRR